MHISRRALVATMTAGVVSVQNTAIAQTAASQDEPRHPVLEACVRSLQSQRWRELSETIVALGPQSAVVLLDELGERAPLGTNFGNLAELPMGATIIASTEVDWAWRFRGTGLGSTVTPEGGRMFDEHLNLAKRHVEQAIAADADDGVARTISFTVYKGLGDLPALYSSLRGYLLSARRPVGGLSAFANAVSQKWYGSEEQTLAFARQTFRLDLPATAGLLPDVHFTCWHARAIGDEQRGQTPETIEAYVANTSARADILTANEAYQAVAPDPDTYANWYANSWFSFMLTAMNEPNLAIPHFLALGGYIGGPWRDLPDPRAAIDGTRRQLGLQSL